MNTFIESIKEYHPNIDSPEHLEHLYVASNLSHIVYLNEENINEEINNKSELSNLFNIQQYQYTTPKHEKLGNTRMLMATTSLVTVGQILYVSFKGTESVSDWMSNVKYTLTEFNKIKLHQGFFLSQFQTPMETIIKGIDNKKYQRIIFCGHSRGGAMAAIATLRLLIERPNADVWSFTFGQPLIGDSSLGDYVRKNGWENRFNCYINKGDPVPFCVFAVNQSYEPFGNVLFLTHKTDNIESSTQSEEVISTGNNTDTQSISNNDNLDNNNDNNTIEFELNNYSNQENEVQQKYAENSTLKSDNIEEISQSQLKDDIENETLHGLNLQLISPQEYKSYEWLPKNTSEVPKINVDDTELETEEEQEEEERDKENSSESSPTSRFSYFSKRFGINYTKDSLSRVCKATYSATTQMFLFGRETLAKHSIIRYVHRIHLLMTPFTEQLPRLLKIPKLSPKPCHSQSLVPRPVIQNYSHIQDNNNYHSPVVVQFSSKRMNESEKDLLRVEVYGKNFTSIDDIAIYFRTNKNQKKIRVLNFMLEPISENSVLRQGSNYSCIQDIIRSKKEIGAITGEINYQKPVASFLESNYGVLYFNLESLKSKITFNAFSLYICTAWYPKLYCQPIYLPSSFTVWSIGPQGSGKSEILSLLPQITNSTENGTNDPSSLGFNYGSVFNILDQKTEEIIWQQNPTLKTLEMSHINYRNAEEEGNIAVELDKFLEKDPPSIILLVFNIAAQKPHNLWFNVFKLLRDAYKKDKGPPVYIVLTHWKSVPLAVRKTAWKNIINELLDLDAPFPSSKPPPVSSNLFSPTSFKLQESCKQAVNQVVDQSVSKLNSSKWASSFITDDTTTCNTEPTSMSSSSTIKLKHTIAHSDTKIFTVDAAATKSSSGIEEIYHSIFTEMRRQDPPSRFKTQLLLRGLLSSAIKQPNKPFTGNLMSVRKHGPMKTIQKIIGSTPTIEGLTF